MPAVIKLRVISATELPVMDSSTHSTDAYVVVTLGDVFEDRTEVARQSLSPQWTRQFFNIEVADDTVLADEALRLRVMDRDIVSADDSIGEVLLDLGWIARRTRPDELLDMEEDDDEKEQPDEDKDEGDVRVVRGWFPVLDTLKGRRGWLRLSLRVAYFGSTEWINRSVDHPEEEEEKADARFFSCSTPPPPLVVLRVLGNVSDLVAHADPEFSWQDAVRKSRSSNRMRRLLLHQLANRLQRRVARQAADMGANTVLHWRVSMDLEGEGGHGALVARGSGTAAVVATMEAARRAMLPSARELMRQQMELKMSPPALGNAVSTGVLLRTPMLSHHKRAMRQARQQQNLTSANLPLLSLNAPPPGFAMHVCGLVSTCTVKLLSQAGREDTHTRQSWWREVRNEVQSHARVLGATHVLGYSEHLAVCDETGVLSGRGTAVRLRRCVRRQLQLLSVPYEEDAIPSLSLPSPALRSLSAQSPHEESDTHNTPCASTHVPVAEHTRHLREHLPVCRACRQERVPELLLTTLEPPAELPSLIPAHVLTVRVVRRQRRHRSGEQLARHVGDTLPFVELELQRRLALKLRLLGANAACAIRSSLAITRGGKLVVASLSGTALLLPNLPLPARVLVRRSLPQAQRPLQQRALSLAQLVERRSKAAVSRAKRLLQQHRREYDHAYAASDTEPAHATLHVDTDLTRLETGNTGDDDERSVVVQVDDDADLDAIRVLLDPVDLSLETATSSTLPLRPFPANDSGDAIRADEMALGMLLAVRRVDLEKATASALERTLSAVFHDMRAELAFRVRAIPQGHKALLCVRSQVFATPEDGSAAAQQLQCRLEASLAAVSPYCGCIDTDIGAVVGPPGRYDGTASDAQSVSDHDTGGDISDGDAKISDGDAEISDGDAEISDGDTEIISDTDSDSSDNDEWISPPLLPPFVSVDTAVKQTLESLLQASSLQHRPADFVQLSSLDCVSPQQHSDADDSEHSEDQSADGVGVTSRSVTARSFGPLHVFEVLEMDVDDSGGTVGTFVQRFCSIALTQLRAQAAARGANAVLCVRVVLCNVKIDDDKVYGVIGMTGDAVRIDDGRCVDGSRVLGVCRDTNDEDVNDDGSARTGGHSRHERSLRARLRHEAAHDAAARVWTASTRRSHGL